MFLSEIRYICSGSCGAKVTVENYKQGCKKCSDDECDNFGKRLERGEYCPNCNTCFEEGDDHICL